MPDIVNNNHMNRYKIMIFFPLIKKTTAIFLFLCLCIGSFAENLPITDIFPLLKRYRHAHGSNIVYFNNSLLVVWFQGDGERQGKHVAIKGALRTPINEEKWSAPFEIAYSGENTPDINPAVLFTKSKDSDFDKLSIYWMKINYHSWDGAEIYKINAKVTRNTPITLDWQSSKKGEPIKLEFPKTFLKDLKNQFSNTWPLKNGRFTPIAYTEDIKKNLASSVSFSPLKYIYGKFNTDLISYVLNLYDTIIIEFFKHRSNNPKYENLGWQTRSNPLRIKLKNGGFRILLPLYSDAFGFSLVAYSDDGGKTWTASSITGRHVLQPTLAEAIDPHTGKAVIIAFMRNNAGIINVFRQMFSCSYDEGITWTPPSPSVLRNAISNITIYKLKYGPYRNWIVMAYNPDDKRHILNIAFWNNTGTELYIKTIEKSDNENYEYPSITQTPDETIFISLTHKKDMRETIGVVSFKAEHIIKKSNNKSPYRTQFFKDPLIN